MRRVLRDHAGRFRGSVPGTVKPPTVAPRGRRVLQASKPEPVEPYAVTHIGVPVPEGSWARTVGQWHNPRGVTAFSDDFAVCVASETRQTGGAAAETRTVATGAVGLSAPCERYASGPDQNLYSVYPVSGVPAGRYGERPAVVTRYDRDGTRFEHEYFGTVNSQGIFTLDDVGFSRALLTASPVARFVDGDEVNRLKYQVLRDDADQVKGVEFLMETGWKTRASTGPFQF